MLNLERGGVAFDPLQERGVVRTDYEGTTLRDHLGLAPRG